VELVAPGGSFEKLRAAFAFGADAAYVGLQNLSLRARAESFGSDDFLLLDQIKKGKKLYCATNIYFRDNDLQILDRLCESSGRMPFDAFIVSDPGALRVIRRRYPDAELHLSTQANCTNAEAARFWFDQGCKRIIAARELSLDEIASIKAAVPDLGIEVFAHGAMCIAYSGRCLLSSWMTGRSGNDGSCAQSCRWEYRLIEERKRPGVSFPIIESDGFTTLLSSKDLCMVDHLRDIRAAGVDAIKIEGRMRSAYYVAITSIAYRSAIDGLDDSSFDYSFWLKELDTVSHREYSTGFYYGHDSIEQPSTKGYIGESLFMGSIASVVNPGVFALDVRNHLTSSMAIEYINPSGIYPLSAYCLTGEYGESLQSVDFGKPCFLRTESNLSPGTLLRRRVAELPTSAYTRKERSFRTSG
jgi:putative protease